MVENFNDKISLILIIISLSIPLLVFLFEISKFYKKIMKKRYEKFLEEEDLIS